MSEIYVKGLRELDAVLSALPQDLQKNAYRAGLRAAGAVIRDEARQRAPRETGKLAKAIRTGSPRQNQDGTFSIRVYVDERREHGFLGYFHEYGVSPHLIAVEDIDRPTYITRRGERKKLTITTLNRKVREGSLVIGSNFVGPSLQHPGHGPQPFLRPAAAEKAGEAAQAFAVRVKAWLEDKTGFSADLGDGGDD